MGDNGWGIPALRGRQDAERRDALEAELILEAIEEEVLPLYYARDESGVLAANGCGAASGP